MLKHEKKKSLFLFFHLIAKPMKTICPAARPHLNLFDFTNGESSILSLF